jgi:hypothetical protein
MSRRRSGLANQRRAYRICCNPPPQPCSPGLITGLISNATAPDFYNLPIDVSWNILPGAISYTVTATSNEDYPPTITRTSTTGANISYDSSSPGQTVTITALTPCGTTSSSIQVQPCFLAGSLVHMADGTTKGAVDRQQLHTCMSGMNEIGKRSQVVDSTRKDA